MDPLFYVGSIGSMLALPDTSDQVDATLERIGGSSVSLLGRQWRDTLGFRRSWGWKYENLPPEQVPYVEALGYGLVPGPLRLVDPRRTNLLPENVASGGSVSRSSRGFAVTVGGVQYRSTKQVAPALQTLGPWRLLRGCQEWLRTSAGDGVLYLAGPQLDGAWWCPLVPGQGPLELTAWVAGQAGVTPTLQWVEYNAAGVGQAYTDPNAEDSIGLSSSTWQRVRALVQPTPSSVALTPRLTVPASAPAGPVLTTGWQVAPVGAESRPGGMQVACDVPELAGGWRIGGGSPDVIAEPAGGAYPVPFLRNTGLTLVETSAY